MIYIFVSVVNIPIIYLFQVSPIFTCCRYPLHHLPISNMSYICFRYYLYLYTHHIGYQLHAFVHDTRNCDDILLNFLVSHVTKYPPIKLTQRKTVRESEEVSQSGDKPAWPSPQRFAQRQQCINEFVQYFGYMPLVRSSLRLDPVLYKDPVSILRKKYRQIERVWLVYI